MAFFDRLHNLDTITLLSLMDGYYELCARNEVWLCLLFFVNNQVFVLKVLRKKWLDEFPEIDLVLDRLEKRDSTFFPPTNIHHNFLYYHL